MKNVFILILCLNLYTGFGQSDIFDVARNGNIDDLIVLINSNKDTINSVSKRGDSPLVLATYYGNNEVALHIAKLVPNIDLQTKDGTPLIAAVYTNNIYLTEELLKIGANTEGKDRAGKTALIYAITSKDVNMVKLLLSFKAKTDIKDKNNYAVIDYAKQTGNEEIINLIRNY